MALLSYLEIEEPGQLPRFCDGTVSLCRAEVVKMKKEGLKRISAQRGIFPSCVNRASTGKRQSKWSDSRRDEVDTIRLIRFD